MRTDPELLNRYLKIRGTPDANTWAKIRSVCESMEETLSPGFIYRQFPLVDTQAGFRLGEDGPLLTGKTAGRMLKGCRSAVVLIATLGFEFDKLLNTSQKRDMAEAVILDACGNAYIEAVADDAEERISTMTDGFLTDRFSPGYGDLPLSLQADMVRLTEADKRLGIHVLSSDMLSPVKTITAFTGIADTPRPAAIRGCEYCLLQDTCVYKKGNGICEAE